MVVGVHMQILVLGGFILICPSWGHHTAAPTWDQRKLPRAKETKSIESTMTVGTVATATWSIITKTFVTRTNRCLNSLRHINISPFTTHKARG